MRAYVPHRQMLVMAASMSASVGAGLTLSSAAAAMIIPDWQYPHCGTWCSIQACWTGCDRSAARPSIVVMALPCAAATGKEQERTGCPPTCTVQAPHAAIPQPYFVPVRPRSSRSTQSSGVSGSASTCTARLLTVKLIMGLPSHQPEPVPRQGQRADSLARRRKHRIAESSVCGDRSELTGAADLCPAFHKARFDRRGFPQMNGFEPIEIGLLQCPVHEGGLRAQARQSPDHAAFRVRGSNAGIERLTAVERAPDVTGFHILAGD